LEGCESGVKPQLRNIPWPQRKRAYWPLLIIVVVASIASHFSLVRTDNGTLLGIDGREVDVLGHFENQWTAHTRDCSSVAVLGPQDGRYVKVENLIKAYSPPSSQSARILGMLSQGDWILAEVEFAELLPAVVSLNNKLGEPTIVPHAVWSGQTRPWVAAPLIRGYLARQAPGMPAPLLHCFEPRTAVFR
jgi:hypothetical protein